MPSTRYKLQQFEWGFRMYDSQTEEPAEGELARFNVNLQEADIIERGGMIEIVNGEVVVTEPVVEGEVL